MIWFIIFLSLLVIEVISFIFIPQGTIRETVLIVVGVIIGSVGFSIKDSINDIRLKKSANKRFKEVYALFNQFFNKSIHVNLEIPKNMDVQISEKEIIDKILRTNNKDFLGEVIHMITLCYYCKKWQLDKSSVNYDSIKKISESLGLKYGEFDETTKLFSKIYSYLIIQENKLDLDKDINPSDLKKSLAHFISNYYKDLQFFEIRDKFHQNKNLHETLINIIKEGKLSTFGVTEDTLKKLNRELSKKSKSSNNFILFTNNTNKEDRHNLKEYIHNFSRIGMAGGTTKMPISAKFGVYIIKTDKNQTTKSLLKDIKNSVKISSEAIIRIVP